MSRMSVLALLLSLGSLCQATSHPPTVSIYTINPLEDGKENQVVCLVDDFHPPDITVDLLKNGNVIQNTQGTDMTFKSDWKYRWMKYFPFTYSSGDEFSCRVSHAQSEPKIYKWDPMY